LKVWDLERALVAADGDAERGTAYAVTAEGRRALSVSGYRTLEVRDLASGRVLATLDGHAGAVRACAVTPDGRYAVSASEDRTLRVWDLETYASLFTHRGDAAFTAVAADATSITARDEDGAECVLGWPPPERRRSAGRGRGARPDRAAPARTQTILFLAANPGGTDARALDREARAIQVELERAGHRDRFDFETRWAVEPLDLLRELRRLRPTVLHFSGRAGRGTAGQSHDLAFHGADGRARTISTEALERTIDAAGASVELVVLSACYSDAHAEALLAHVDCVVGIGGVIDDDVARAFASGFYGGLGELESIAAAYRQGCAAICLEGSPNGARPRLRVRAGVDADRLVLAADPR
jgi:hypothetical protein